MVVRGCKWLTGRHARQERGVHGSTEDTHGWRGGHAWHRGGAHGLAEGTYKWGGRRTGVGGGRIRGRPSQILGYHCMGGVHPFQSITMNLHT
jgi:hypothetical protein